LREIDLEVATIGDCFFGYDHAVRRGGKGTSEFLRSSALEQTSRGGMITQLANLVLTVVFIAFMVVVGQRHIESKTLKVAKAAPAALSVPAL
jgi:hypothetical protein